MDVVDTIRKNFWIVLGIFFIAFVLSILYLPYLHIGMLEFGGDAGHAIAAKELLEKHEFNFYYFCCHPPLSILLMSLSFLFFGCTEFAARSVPFIFSIIGAIFLFLLGCRISSKTSAFLSTCFFIFSTFLFWGIYRWWIDFLTTVFIVVGMYFFICYLQNNSSRYLFLCGIFSGLAIFTKEAALLLFPVYIISLHFSGRFIRNSFPLFVPMFFFYALWVSSYSILHGASRTFYNTIIYFINQLFSASGYFVPLFSFLYEFVGSVTIFVIFFSVIGIYFSFKKKKFYRIPLLTWLLLFFIIFMLSPSRLLRYHLPVLPPLLIFFSVGVEETFHFLGKIKYRLPLRMLFVSGILLISFNYFSIYLDERNDYFKSWENTPRNELIVFINENTTTDTKFLVIGDPPLLWISFYTDRQAYHLFPHLGIPIDNVLSKEDTYYIILGEKYLASNAETLASFMGNATDFCNMTISIPDNRHPGDNHLLFKCF